MGTAAHLITGRASADGLEIAFEAAGVGEPAFIFIPGAFEDRSYFASQLAHFAASRRVATVELRGQGQSSRVATATLDDYAADVIAAAEAAGIRRAILCGHSVGAAIALKVASARPALVRGIAMLDGAILFPEPVRQYGLTTLIPALATDHWLAALRAYFGNVILTASDPADLVARVMADVESQARPELARAVFTDIFASDLAHEIEQASCPLLYIRAKAPADLKRWMELRPDALVGQVVGSGHYLMLTAADQLNAMLDRFAALVAAPTPAASAAEDSAN